MPSYRPPALTYLGRCACGKAFTTMARHQRNCSSACRERFASRRQWTCGECGTRVAKGSMLCWSCRYPGSATYPGARRLEHQAVVKWQPVAVGIRWQRVFTVGLCRGCGKHVTVTHTQAYSCGTDECARAILREKSRRRRARLRGGRVGRVVGVVVFERDGWACYLCGLPVVREPVPHPLAPTIDHVIPLARGGSHSMDNVRCAHFLCNSKKRDIVLI